MKSDLRISKKELLKLPERDWSSKKQYDYLIIVPTNELHDSNWRLMAIIGCNNDGTKEIAAYCDDINLEFPRMSKFCFNFIHNDMTQSNLIRYWSNFYNFEVGASLSTTDVKLIEKEN